MYLALALVSLSLRHSISLPDLTEQFTPRADDRHALPLGLSGKIFGLTFTLPSLLVIFPTLDSIKPQHPPLVCSPANCFKFQTCVRTPQAADLTLTLRYCKHSRCLQHQSLHHLLLGLLGYSVDINMLQKPFNFIRVFKLYQSVEFLQIIPAINVNFIFWLGVSMPFINTKAYFGLF